MSNYSIRRAVLVITLCAPALSAQVGRRSRTEGFSWPAVGGLAAIQMRPTDEFGRVVGFGYGVEGAGAIGLDPWGVLKLRGSAGGVWYGNESSLVPLSPTVGGRITAKLVTNNMLSFGTIGPEVTIPWGPVRPYYHAGYGFIYLSTNSHLEDANGGDDHFETHNFGDATSTGTEGAGVRIALTPVRRIPIMLDFGATRFTGGRAQYLREGSIVDRPDGSIQISSFESPVHFWTWRLGVTIGR